MKRRVGPQVPNSRKTYFREWREFRGLTQAQLAVRLKTTQASVSRLESGRFFYNQPSLEAWANALQCEPADLISRDPNLESPVL